MYNVDLSDCKICLERSPFCHHERSLRFGGQQSSEMVLSLGECQLVSVWVERPLDSMRIWMVMNLVMLVVGHQWRGEILRMILFTK